MDHDAILNALVGLRQKRHLHLVARIVSSEVSVPRNKAWFFIPDLHLLTKASAREYKYSFIHNQDKPTGREALLADLCQTLKRMGAGKGTSPQLFVFQLGDFVDVWRENRIAEIEDLAGLVNRVFRDNPAAKAYLCSRTELGTFLLCGNHDRVNANSLIRVPATRRMKNAFALPTSGDVIAAHGDYFDHIEDLPDRWSRWGSRFTRYVGPDTKSFKKAVEIRSPSDVPDQLGVCFHHRLFPRVLTTARRLRRGRSRTLKRMGFRTRKNARAFVIGHTHRASIGYQHGTIIMDCGAWLGLCKLPNGRVVPSCQVGVVARTGTGVDFRVYQLTPKIR